MHIPPQPSTYGQITAFHRSLYKGLLQDGYNHEDISRMSLRKALLAKYGSAEVIDQVVGPGTYEGVKQPVGGVSTWRTSWSRVRKQQKALYLRRMAALAVLKEDIAACKEAGTTEMEIRIALQEALSHRNRRQASRRDH